MLYADQSHVLVQRSQIVAHGRVINHGNETCADVAGCVVGAIVTSLSLTECGLPIDVAGRNDVQSGRYSRTIQEAHKPPSIQSWSIDFSKVIFAGFGKYECAKFSRVLLPFLCSSGCCCVGCRRDRRAGLLQRCRRVSIKEDVHHCTDLQYLDVVDQLHPTVTRIQMTKRFEPVISVTCSLVATPRACPFFSPASKMVRSEPLQGNCLRSVLPEGIDAGTLCPSPVQATLRSRTFRKFISADEAAHEKRAKSVSR
jgi:hypothetical protein